MMTQTRKAGIEFKRESNRNYMIIRPGKDDTGRGAARMLSGNPVPGLLLFSEKVFNGETLFYYDITSKQPLRRILESRDITGIQLRSLLMDLLSVLNEMERFFLDEDQLSLDADMIYVDPDTFGTAWCVIPGEKGDFPQDFREFAQYLLDHINNNDSDAVVLAFGIFRQSRKENFGLEDLGRELTKTAGGEQPSNSEKADHSHVPYLQQEPAREPSHAGQEFLSAGREEALPAGRNAKPLYDASDTGAGSRGSFWWYLLIVPLVLMVPVAVCFMYGFGGILRYRTIIAATEIATAAAGVIIITLLIVRPRGGRDAPSGKKGKKVSPADAGERKDTSKMGKDLKNRKKLEKEGADATDERKARDRTKKTQEISEREELEIIFREAEDPAPYGRMPEDAQDFDTDPADDDCFMTQLLSVQPVEFSRRRLVSLADGHVTPVPYFPFLIGKNKSICDYCPDDAGVSRLHLKITDDDDEYFVTDLNSTNGTYINGRLLGPDETCSIKPGDEIRIAAGRYRFE